MSKTNKPEFDEPVPVDPLETVLEWIRKRAEADAEDRIGPPPLQMSLMVDAVNELAATNKRLADLGRKVEKERDEALKNLEGAQNRIFELDGQVIKQRENEEHAEGVIAELNASVAEGNKVREEIKNDYEDRLRSQRAEIDKLRLDLTKSQNEGNDLRDEIGSLRSTVAHAVEAKDKLTKENGTLTERVANQDRQLTELRKASDVREGELLQERLTSARLMGYIEALEDQQPPRVTQNVEHKGSILDRVRPGVQRPNIGGRW